VVLEIAKERQHEPMTVDDAGLRRAQRRDAGELRLERLCGSSIDDLHPFDAVELRLLEQRFEAGHLACVGRNHKLSAFAMRHAMRGAEVVEHAPAARTVMRAQRAGRIIEPGVDYLAVARGYSGSDRARRLGDDHLLPGDRQSTRDRKPNRPGPDHEDLHSPRSAHVSTGSPT
jgi:hypothetical protein